MTHLMLYDLFVSVLDRKIVVFKKDDTLGEHVINRLNGQPFIFATYRNADEFLNLVCQYKTVDSSTLVFIVGDDEEAMEVINASQARHLNTVIDELVP
jgi:hypothetical protein